VLEGKVAVTQKEAAATPSDFITCLTRGQTGAFLTDEITRIFGFGAETVSGTAASRGASQRQDRLSSTRWSPWVTWQSSKEVPLSGKEVPLSKL
jgi:hypothetical protein